jgi:prepilin-type N-terminal cleavage/methylation domain-containing protein
MTRLSEERGWTLVELLVTISLLSVVIGATVTTFTSSLTNDRAAQQLNEAQDQARQASGKLARELRNLAGPTDYQPEAIDKAEPYDLVFQTVDPVANGDANDRNIKRVRYCLAPPEDGISTLWVQEQPWPGGADPGQPSTTSCPDGGWAEQRLAATNILNMEDERPLFAFTPEGADETEIRAIRTQLFVDTDLRDSRPLVRLASGVFLRNQNRAPVASFTATYTGNARQVVLNGSASEDPEGHSLEKYTWYLEGGSTPIATGAVAYWAAPAAGTYRFRLVVEDHAGLTGEASGEGVTVP